MQLRSEFALDEDVRISISRLDSTLDAGINGTGLLNALDNLVISMLANECRATNPGGVDYHIVSHDFAYVGPVGVILALISFVIDYWYKNRYRDDWEAYWSLEIERFDKRYASLNQLPQKISQETKNDLMKIYAVLAWFHNHTLRQKTQFEADTIAYKKELTKIQEIENRINNLKQLLRTWLADTEIQTIEQELKKERPNKTPPEKLAEQYEQEAIERANEEAEKKKAPLEAASSKNSWLDVLHVIPETSVFNVIFAFSWNYWAVFFFTLWGIPDAWQMVPLDWGLLALIAPILYLGYKEAEFYQQECVEVVKEELKFNKELKDSPEKEKINRIKEAQLKYRKNHADRQAALSRLRIFGWLFVGLVMSFSVGMLTGNFYYAAFTLVGVGVFAGLFTFGLDKHFEENHLTQSLPGKNPSRDQLIEVAVTRKKVAFERRYAQKWVDFQIQAILARENLITQQTRIENDIEDSLGQKVKLTSEEIFLGENLKYASPKLSPEQLQAAQSQDTEYYISPLEKIRRVVAPFVSFFVGYMLGIIIGFATSDFLSHFIGVAALGPEANGIIGGLGLIIASSFAYRAWCVDEVHRKELSDIRETGDYKEHQAQFNYLNEQILLKREALKKLVNKIKEFQEARADLSQHQEQFEKTYDITLKLLEEPEKTVSKVKILKNIRRVFNVLINISSVMLMSRALLVMGFAGIFAFSSGSITIIGIDACSPFAIAVFTIAAFLLILKAGNETYLQMQKEKELRHAKYIELKLERVQIQMDNLLQIEKKLDEAYVNLDPNSSSDLDQVKRDLADAKKPTVFEEFWSKGIFGDSSCMPDQSTQLGCC